MFYNFNNIKQPPSCSYNSYININDNNEYTNLVDNNENELLLTSPFTPIPFFDLQQQYSYQPMMMAPSSSNITHAICSPLVFYDNKSIMFNENDSDRERQQQQPCIPVINNKNNDDHPETFWEHNHNNAALIRMLLTASADASFIDDNDDPFILCSSNNNNNLTSSPSPVTITTTMIDNNDQSSTFTIKPSSSPLTIREKSQRKKRKSNSNARMGYCQHPKHMYYREENTYVPKTLISSPPIPATSSSSTTTSNTLTPRRGRPPKGTKAIDKKGVKEGYIWAMTVRPLPKRLEAVVGERSIKVCLTCLKRSDLDQDYLNDPAYVGPQQQQQHYVCSSKRNKK